MKDNRKSIVCSTENATAIGEPIYNSPEWMVSVTRGGVGVVGTSSQWMNDAWRASFDVLLTDLEKQLVDHVLLSIVMSNSTFDHDMVHLTASLLDAVRDDNVEAAELVMELDIAFWIAINSTDDEILGVYDRPDLLQSYRAHARSVPFLIKKGIYLARQLCK